MGRCDTKLRCSQRLVMDLSLSTFSLPQRMTTHAKRAHLRRSQCTRHVSGSSSCKFHWLDFTCSILIRWRWKLHLSGHDAPYWLTSKQTEQFHASTRRWTVRGASLPPAPSSPRKIGSLSSVPASTSIKSFGDCGRFKGPVHHLADLSSPSFSG